MPASLPGRFVAQLELGELGRARRALGEALAQLRQQSVARGVVRTLLALCHEAPCS